MINLFTVWHSFCKKLVRATFLLEFAKRKTQISALNPALTLILQKNKGLQNEKAEDIAISENGSGDVARAGAFSKQFIEGMKLFYELEPLIKVKPYLTNQWEKSGLAAKRAS